MESPSPQDSCGLDHSASNVQNKLDPHRSTPPSIAATKRQANVLFVFRIATLTISLIGALRVLVCPKPLSEVELNFLKWSLGISAVLLGLLTAMKRKLQKQLQPDEPHGLSED